MKEANQDGVLAIRTLAMPADTNPNGDIFGGWVLSQMDLAGLSIARKLAKCKVVTVAVDSMSFIAPVRVGDFICCYAKLIHTGRTSMQVAVTTYAIGPHDEERRQVTKGTFTYVAVDEQDQPKPVA